MEDNSQTGLRSSSLAVKLYRDISSERWQKGVRVSVGTTDVTGVSQYVLNSRHNSFGVCILGPSATRSERLGCRILNLSYFRAL